MEKEIIPMLLNEKDICTDALVDALGDSCFRGSIERGNTTHDYFTVYDSVWCVVYQFNCHQFILQPVDWEIDTHYKTVQHRLEDIVEELNEFADDEYKRRVYYRWVKAVSPYMEVKFNYEK